MSNAATSKDNNCLNLSVARSKNSRLLRFSSGSFAVLDVVEDDLTTKPHKRGGVSKKSSGINRKFGQPDLHRLLILD